MVLKKGNSNRWGLTTNSQGLGSYIKLTKEDGKYNVRKWSGNSFGFPHTGGYHGTETFNSKNEAIRFIKNHIQKYPGYTKDGNRIANLDGTFN